MRPMKGKGLRLARGAYRTVAGRHYGSAKEVWGFRTRPASGPARAAAELFLRVNRDLLSPDGRRIPLAWRKTLRSAGATHVIFQQRHHGDRIHRAYVTVHIGRDRRAYLLKNRAVPPGLLPAHVKARVTPVQAMRAAERSATRGRSRRGRRIVLRRAETERLWFPRGASLRLAWRVRVHCTAPREEWIVYVDAVNRRILNRYDNLALARRAVRGRARVFDPNPVAALGGTRELLRADGSPVARVPEAAYRTVALRDLAGTGRLDGARVTTAPTRGRVTRSDHRFEYEAHDPRGGFEEAMVYYHIDRAVRYLESLGYRGERAIFTRPVPVNVNGTTEDNSWYSPALRRLTFGTGGVDDAEDGETILHELGHAIQDAICPDFGQSEEAAAMGEGFSDYFAASFFASRKPRALEPCVMSWDGVTFARDDGPPCVRRVDGGLTYEDFRHGDEAEEHDNGEIWSATLWEINRRLGRDTADRLIIESHFQLDGFTTFARGARAIMDADRNLFGGRHLAALRAVFARRGIGPV